MATEIRATVAQDRPELTGARWSSAVVCTRRAVYEHHGAPVTPVAPEVEGWRWRGQVIGDAVQHAVVAQWRALGRRPVAELEIPWPPARPFARAHADIWVPHERRMVEVKSAAGCVLNDSAVLQVVGQVVFHPRAQYGTVLVIDPSSGEERQYPVNVDARADEVWARVEEVRAGVEDGVLPDRVCRHPGDGPALMCDRVEHCFDGWVRPDINRLPGFGDLVRALADAEAACRREKKPPLEWVQKRDEIRARLRGVMEPGVEYVVNGWRLKRTEVAGSRAFRFTAMEKAGFALPLELEPFLTEGKGHERWIVEPVDVV